jgi:hypothetical protein
MNCVVSYDSEGNPTYSTDTDDNVLPNSGKGRKDVVGFNSEGNPTCSTDADDNALANSGVEGKDEEKERGEVSELVVEANGEDKERGEVVSEVSVGTNDEDKHTDREEMSDSNMVTNGENNDRPREETMSDSNSGRNGDHSQGNKAETTSDSNGDHPKGIRAEAIADSKDDHPQGIGAETISVSNGDHPQGIRAKTISNSNVETNCECKHSEGCVDSNTENGNRSRRSDGEEILSALNLDWNDEDRHRARRVSEWVSESCLATSEGDRGRAILGRVSDYSVATNEDRDRTRRVSEWIVAMNEVRQRTRRVSESCVATRGRDRGRRRRVSGCNDGDRRTWRVSNCNAATADGDRGRAILGRGVSDSSVANCEDRGRTRRVSGCDVPTNDEDRDRALRVSDCNMAANGGAEGGHPAVSSTVTMAAEDDEDKGRERRRFPGMEEDFFLCDEGIESDIEDASIGGDDFVLGASNAVDDSDFGKGSDRGAKLLHSGTGNTDSYQTVRSSDSVDRRNDEDVGSDIKERYSNSEMGENSEGEGRYLAVRFENIKIESDEENVREEMSSYFSVGEDGGDNIGEKKRRFTESIIEKNSEEKLREREQQQENGTWSQEEAERQHGNIDGKIPAQDKGEKELCSE